MTEQGIDTTSQRPYCAATTARKHTSNAVNPATGRVGKTSAAPRRALKAGKLWRQSLAGELVVKAAHADGECLEGAHGIAVVHGEGVVGALSEL